MSYTTITKFAKFLLSFANTNLESISNGETKLDFSIKHDCIQACGMLNTPTSRPVSLVPKSSNSFQRLHNFLYKYGNHGSRVQDRYFLFSQFTKT